MDLKVLKAFVLGLLFVCLLTLLGVYHVWRQSNLVELGTKLGEASTPLREVKKQNALLSGEYHTLRANPEIIRKAEEKLKMRRPSDREIFRMDGQSTDKKGEE